MGLFGPSDKLIDAYEIPLKQTIEHNLSTELIDVKTQALKGNAET